MGEDAVSVGGLGRSQGHPVLTLDPDDDFPGMPLPLKG